MKRGRFALLGVVIAMSIAAWQPASAASIYADAFVGQCSYGFGTVAGGYAGVFACNQPLVDVSANLPAAAVNPYDFGYVFVYIVNGSGFDYGSVTGSRAAIVADPLLSAGSVTVTVPSAIYAGQTLTASLVLKGLGGPPTPYTYHFENPAFPTYAYGYASAYRDAEIDASGVSTVTSSSPVAGGPITSNVFAAQLYSVFGYVYASAP